MTEVIELRTGGFSVRLTGTRWEWAATREHADRIIAKFEEERRASRAARKSKTKPKPRPRRRKPRREAVPRDLVDAAPFHMALADANIKQLADTIGLDQMAVRAVKKRKRIEYDKAVKLCLALGKDPVEMGV